MILFGCFQYTLKNPFLNTFGLLLKYYLKFFFGYFWILLRYILDICVILFGYFWDTFGMLGDLGPSWVLLGDLGDIG